RPRCAEVDSEARRAVMHALESVVGRRLPRGSSWRRMFLNDPATTEIYTLSLHDALPISADIGIWRSRFTGATNSMYGESQSSSRSEKHTSELQSRGHLVCRLLLEKKKSTGGRQSGGRQFCAGRPVAAFRAALSCMPGAAR